MKISLFMFFSFIFGVLVGVYLPVAKALLHTGFVEYALYVLLFLVGISIGCSKTALKALLGVRFRLIFVPLVVIFGTLLGNIAVSLIIPSMGLRDIVAVGFGFGYYSLSSVIITQLKGEILGTIALLSNMFRELATILLAPALIKCFGKLASIASGGATSMDTTLPIHVKFAGKEYAAASVFSGVVLTIAVPFLIVLILR